MELKTSFLVVNNHNHDAEISDDRYRYRGSTTANLLDVRATVGEWKGDIHWSREEIPVNFTPRSEMVCYVVFVHYETGDTFGNDGRIKPVATFETQEKADALERLIEEDVRQNPRTYESFTFENVEIYPGDWKGYFERFHFCSTMMITVEP